MAKSLKKHALSRGWAVQAVDVDSLQVWHGRVLELALEVDRGQIYTFYSGAPEGDKEWHALRDTLPAAQGGVMPDGNPDALDQHWLRPVRDGPVLPDFTLSGPLELWLDPPAESLGLWLPHPAEVGRVRRIVLRQGAAVSVRGAQSVRLRRAVDLPSVSLSDFAAIAMEDRDKANAAGIVHLATGLRERAVLRWNDTEEGHGTTPALVALTLAMGEGGGTLLAAPDDTGRLQRLRVRRMGEGVVELSLRAELRPMDGKALALNPSSPYMWPLRSALPETLQSYELLLREVLASQIFGAGGEGGAAGSGPRPVEDVPLRLRKSTAEALMLVRMELEVDRPVNKQLARQPSGSDSGEGDAAGADASPTPQQLLQRQVLGGGHRGRRETWQAVVRMDGNVREGLRFTPVQFAPLRGESETTTFSDGALQGMMQGNISLPAEWAMVA